VPPASAAGRSWPGRNAAACPALRRHGPPHTCVPLPPLRPLRPPSSACAGPAGLPRLRVAQAAPPASRRPAAAAVATAWPLHGRNRGGRKGNGGGLGSLMGGARLSAPLLMFFLLFISAESLIICKKNAEKILKI